MNKKFLSAILFGALMVTATGTFVSCKDYDDEIDELNTRVDGIESQLKDLKSAVDNGKWITNVEPTATGLTITMNDGKTYPLTNGKDGDKGEKGEAGSKVTIDSTTGKITIDGTETEFFAVKNTETGKFAVPEIGEDGFWYIVNKEGKLEQTSYKASPISAVQDPNTNIWTLKVWNTVTKAYDEIKLPTAANTFTELEILGLNGSIEDQGELTVNYWKIAEDSKKNVDEKDWAGPKKPGLSKGTLVYSAQQPILLRIAPATADATGTEVVLVDSKAKTTNVVLTPLTGFDGTLYARAAAEGTGLYETKVAPATFASTKDDASDFTSAFAKKDDKAKLFAVKVAETSFVSNYNLAVTVSPRTAKLEEIYVNEDEVLKNTGKGTNGNPVYVNLGDDNTISFKNNAADVYDSYIEFNKDDIVLFGLTKDDSKMTFKATTMPDNISKVTTPVTIHYMLVDGMVRKKVVYVKVTKGQSSTYTYDTVQFTPASDNHSFNVGLKDMKDKMTAAQLALWNKTANIKDATVEFYSLKDGKEVSEDFTNGINAAIYNKVTDKAETASTTAEANIVRFDVDDRSAADKVEIGKTYYARYTFANTDDPNDKLNTIIIPFVFKIPAIEDMFPKQDGVWIKDTNGNYVANAYMAATATDKDVDATYAFGSAFHDWANVLKKSAMKFKLKPDETATVVKVKNTEYKSNDLASVTVTDEINNTNAELVKIQLTPKVEVDETTNTPLGYKKTLTINVIDAKYMGYYKYGKANDGKEVDYSFQISVMSPLLEGKVKAVNTNGIIDIPVTKSTGFNIDGSMISATTYGNIPYSIFADKLAGDNSVDWTRAEVKDVEFETTDKNIFTFSEANASSVATTGKGTAATKDSKGNVVAGHVTVYPVNVAKTTEPVNMNITVTDAWGYTLHESVKVRVVVD